MKASFLTLGCKVNQYETGAMEALLRERGHQVAGDGPADVYVVNTCAVTAESGRKSRQAIRRIQRTYPGALVAVCGCFSQISPEEVADLGADLVCGSGDRSGFVAALERLCAEKAENPRIRIRPPERAFEQLPAGEILGRTRAFLKIQDGCDNYCTYCIIPYARGPVRSMPPDAAVKAAFDLRAAGHQELVITGIEISAYGKDFGEPDALQGLITRIGKEVPGLRLRLGSLEPRVVTEPFVHGLAAVPGLCRHFHLSLQSGCDATLRRMGRRYDTARFLKSIKLLRTRFPNCAITTDLIVGFPGETEAEFNETLTFIRKCAFSDMHIFPYSIRPGTRAASMENQLSKSVKTERAAAAEAVSKKMRAAYLSSQMGETLDVLFERETETGAVGHTDTYLLAFAPGAARGEVHRVDIMGVSDEILQGKIITSV